MNVPPIHPQYLPVSHPNADVAVGYIKTRIFDRLDHHFIVYFQTESTTTKTKNEGNSSVFFFGYIFRKSNTMHRHTFFYPLLTTDWLRHLMCDCNNSPFPYIHFLEQKTKTKQVLMVSGLMAVTLIVQIQATGYEAKPYPSYPSPGDSAHSSDKSSEEVSIVQQYLFGSIQVSLSNPRFCPIFADWLLLFILSCYIYVPSV